jgi:hypothetical protein
VKKLYGIGCGNGGYLLYRDAIHRPKGIGYIGEVATLIAFAPVGYRSKVGGIGLQHKVLQRYLL